MEEESARRQAPFVTGWGSTQCVFSMIYVEFSRTSCDGLTGSATGVWALVVPLIGSGGYEVCQTKHGTEFTIR